MGLSCGAVCTPSTASSSSRTSDAKVSRIKSGRDGGQCVAHVGQPVPQRRGRPNRRSRRIVQLMGEARREGAERKEALSLLKDLLRALRAEEQTLKEMERHREPIPHQLRELLGPEHEESRPHVRAQRVVVHLPDPVTEVRLKRSGVHAAGIGAVDLDIVGADSAEQRDRTFQEDVERGGRLTFAEDPAGLDLLDVPFSTQPAQLFFIQFLEQEESPNLVDITGKVVSSSHHLISRYRCTSMTAMAPSPTAEATRLADSARASPATNTPGILLSRWYGARSSIQPAGRSPTRGRSGPVITKPRSSRTTTPSSHSVRGNAPMNTNRSSASTTSVAPDVLSRRVSVSKCSSPLPAITSVHVRTSMFEIVSICCTR